MREPVVLRLEQLSYYHHLSLAGGRDRPISAYRLVDIRGSRFQVLSRIQDTGLDFTGRTNFIAHHLVFAPDEATQMPTPAMIFRRWGGWVTTWNGEPQLLSTEEWSGLTTLLGTKCLPATTWAALTGEAANGYGLLEVKPGVSFCPEATPEDTLLDLLAESTELLEARDTRRDARVSAWQWTFTTSCQEQDYPGEFRWRFVYRDNPAFAKLSGNACVSLPSVRVFNCNEEERAFAQKGWQPAQRVRVAPISHPPIQEGEKGVFQATADGTPSPVYQWYEIEVGTRRPKLLKGESSPKLVVRPHRGVTRYRVEAYNRANEGKPAFHDVSIEVRPACSAGWGKPSRPTTAPKRNAGLVTIDDGEEKEREKRRNVQQAEVIGKVYPKQQEQRRIFRWIVIPTAILGIFTVTLVAWTHGWFAKRQNVANTTLLQKSGLPTNPAQTDANFPENNALRQMSPVSQDPADQDSTKPSSSGPKPSSTCAQAVNGKQELGTRDRDDWDEHKIGAAHISFSKTNDTFTLIGSGSNIFTNSDNCSFLSRHASQSVMLSARLNTLTPASGRRCGLMMRASDQADAPFVFFGLDPSTKLYWIRRSEKGGSCSSTTLERRNLPFYLCLAREGDTFKGALSGHDGSTNWQWVMQEDHVIMAQTNYLVGFALCSGSLTNNVTAVFSDVHMKPTQAANR